MFEGRYAIHELLGAGAFGAVYRATQMAMQREVALKVLKAELIREPSLTARFRQEARTLAGLKHPGIIELIDFGETSDGRLFLVTELLTGETLADLLEREAPLPQVRVVSLAIEALDALADAHHAGIIHRDLKPENLFIARQGRRGESLKILDFGIAKLADDDPSRLAVTAAGMTLGSPRFMSPEQCMAGPVSPQSDLYSLGLVLYEAISGRPAFDKQTAMEYMMAHVREEPPPPSIDGMVLRGPHIDLIMQCLEKDPARRPASAAAAAAGFGAVHSRLPTAMGVASARPGAGEAGEATQFVGAEATQFVGAEATQFVGARPPAPSDSAAETVAVPVDAAVARAFAAAAEGTAAAPSTTDDAWTVVVPSPLAARGGGEQRRGSAGFDGVATGVTAALTWRPATIAAAVGAAVLLLAGGRWLLQRGGEPAGPAATTAGPAPSKQAAGEPAGVTPAAATPPIKATTAARTAEGAAPTVASQAKKTLTVTVDSEPSSAVVLQDGKPLGTTPLDVSWPADGSPPALELRLPGYERSAVVPRVEDAGGRYVTELSRRAKAPASARAVPPAKPREHAPAKPSGKERLRYEMVE